MRDINLRSYLAEELFYSEKFKLFLGRKEGYTFYMKRDKAGAYRLHFCLSREGKKPTKEAIAKIIKGSEILDGFQVNDYEVVYRFRNQKDADSMTRSIKETLSSLPQIFAEKKYLNCEEERGNPGETSLYANGEGFSFFDERAFRKREMNLAGEKERFMAVSKNPEKGLLGAFLGALLGAVVIVVAGQLRVFAVMQGLLMGVLTIYGYRLTGKCRSRKTNVMVMVLMFLFIIIAHHLNFAILFSKAHPNYTWLEAAAGGVGLFMAEAYFAQLLLIVIFSSFVYLALATELRKQNRQFILEKIEE